MTYDFSTKDQKAPVVLASQSPRRREILSLCGIPFFVHAAKIDEIFDSSLPIEKATEQLAVQKATAVQKIFPEKIILGADTIVSVDGKVLGKPRDPEDAFSMLSLLSGRSHQVVTGVCLLSPRRKSVFSQISKVCFFPLQPEEIREYIKTQEPMDKAGAYGIQGKGALFIEEIQGDFFSIMGLPVASLYREIKKLFP